MHTIAYMVLEGFIKVDCLNRLCFTPCTPLQTCSPDDLPNKRLEFEHLSGWELQAHNAWHWKLLASVSLGAQELTKNSTKMMVWGLIYSYVFPIQDLVPLWFLNILNAADLAQSPPSHPWPRGHCGHQDRRSHWCSAAAAEDSTAPPVSLNGPGWW